LVSAFAAGAFLGAGLRAGALGAAALRDCGFRAGALRVLFEAPEDFEPREDAPTDARLVVPPVFFRAPPVRALPFAPPEVFLRALPLRCSAMATNY
jgi:hypothetical protein